MPAILFASRETSHQRWRYRRRPSEEWEFRPTRVPGSILLRNLGIQVVRTPLLLSLPAPFLIDTPPVYFPKGLASSRTLVLLSARHIEPDDDAAPVQYNVYVLDADAGKLREDIPELMMRVFKSGEWARRVRAHDGGSGGMQVDAMRKIAADERGARRGPFRSGHLHARRRRRIRSTSGSVSATAAHGRDGDLDNAEGATRTQRRLWRGRCTAGACVPAYHRERHRVWRSGVARDDDPQDPFNYNITSAPPEAGRGYNICVECLEMAPVPSPAHLRGGPRRNARGVLGAAGQEDKRVQHTADDERDVARARVLGAVFEACRRAEAEYLTSPTILLLPHPALTRSLSSPGFRTSSKKIHIPCNVPSPQPVVATQLPRTRPLKVLIYSSDAYTESFPPALSLLMVIRKLSLPEAYVELQVTKKRSFFVYPR
ncbi:hypothetical protein MKEN_01116800 [Mycena kentingensis (nom. inval.)]|nr:hypothetical protein MKEN_01116800 [Mycena kentingensis (nom. inval.)]